MCFFTRLRREGDGAPDLDDHLGHGLAQARNLFVELLEIFRAVTCLRIPDMQVQHRGARVVAIDRLLRLLLPSDRNVFREVAWEPLRPERRDRDDERLLIFWKHRVVSKIHSWSPLLIKKPT